MNQANQQADNEEQTLSTQHLQQTTSVGYDPAGPNTSEIPAGETNVVKESRTKTTTKRKSKRQKVKTSKQRKNGFGMKKC